MSRQNIITIISIVRSHLKGIISMTIQCCGMMRIVTLLLADAY